MAYRREVDRDKRIAQDGRYPPRRVNPPKARFAGANSARPRRFWEHGRHWGRPLRMGIAEASLGRAGGDAHAGGDVAGGVGDDGFGRADAFQDGGAVVVHEADADGDGLRAVIAHDHDFPPPLAPPC